MQYSMEIRAPWNEVKNTDAYIHITNSVLDLRGGGTMDRPFGKPSNGINTKAALTAFLKNRLFSVILLLYNG